MLQQIIFFIKMKTTQTSVYSTADVWLMDTCTVLQNYDEWRQTKCFSVFKIEPNVSKFDRFGVSLVTIFGMELGLNLSFGIKVFCVYVECILNGILKKIDRNIVFAVPFLNNLLDVVHATQYHTDSTVLLNDPTELN